MEIQLEGYDAIVPNVAYAKVPTNPAGSYILTMERFRTATVDEAMECIKRSWDVVKRNRDMKPQDASNSLEALFTYFPDQDAFEMLTGANFAHYCDRERLLTEPVLDKVGFLYGFVPAERFVSTENSSGIYDLKPSMIETIEHIDGIIAEGESLALSLKITSGRLPDFTTIESNIMGNDTWSSELRVTQRHSQYHVIRLLKTIYEGLDGKMDTLFQRDRQNLVSRAACQAITSFMEAIGIIDPLEKSEREAQAPEVPATIN